MSLLVSCAGWDTKQLMAFAADKLSAFTATLPPWPLSDRALLLLSWNTHVILTHHSKDEAFLLHLSLMLSLRRPHSSDSPSFRLWIMNLCQSGWTLAIHPEKTQTIQGSRLQIPVQTQSSLFRFLLSNALQRQMSEYFFYVRSHRDMIISGLNINRNEPAKCE